MKIAIEGRPLFYGKDEDVDTEFQVFGPPKRGLKKGEILLVSNKVTLKFRMKDLRAALTAVELSQ